MLSPGKQSVSKLCAPQSSSFTGKVIGRRPEGHTSPERTSAIGSPASEPIYQACTTASTLSIHGMAKALPVRNTVTIGLPVSVSDVMRRSWQNGRLYVWRSPLSQSWRQFLFSPPTYIIRSALPAASIASAYRRSYSSCGTSSSWSYMNLPDLYPMANCTFSLPKRVFSASSGVIRRRGFSSDEPPPAQRSFTAFSPTTSMR